MSEVAENVRVVGTAWIAFDPESDRGDDYWAEGVAVTVKPERTDTNEVAVHLHLDADSSADVSLFLTDGEAARLMMALGQALLA